MLYFTWARSLNSVRIEFTMPHPEGGSNCLIESSCGGSTDEITRFCFDDRHCFSCDRLCGKKLKGLGSPMSQMRRIFSNQGGCRRFSSHSPPLRYLWSPAREKYRETEGSGNRNEVLIGGFQFLEFIGFLEFLEFLEFLWFIWLPRMIINDFSTSKEGEWNRLTEDYSPFSPTTTNPASTDLCRYTRFQSQIFRSYRKPIFTLCRCYSHPPFFLPVLISVLDSWQNPPKGVEFDQ